MQIRCIKLFYKLILNIFFEEILKTYFFPCEWNEYTLKDKIKSSNAMLTIKR